MVKLTGVLSHISREQALLIKARREADINSTVASFANPMSKRAVEFSMLMDNYLDEVISAVTVDGDTIQAGAANLLQVNSAIRLALQSVQEIKDHCSADRTKHLVAKVSKHGWAFVSSVEECEGKVGHLDMALLRSQEKAYL